MSVIDSLVRMASYDLGSGQLFGDIVTRANQYLIRRPGCERGVRLARIVLLDVQCNHLVHRDRDFERFEIQPLLPKFAPPRFAHAVRELIGGFADAAFQKSCMNELFAGRTAAFGSAVRKQGKHPLGVHVLFSFEQGHRRAIGSIRSTSDSGQNPAREGVDHGAQVYTVIIKQTDQCGYYSTDRARWRRADADRWLCRKFPLLRPVPAVGEDKSTPRARRCKEVSKPLCQPGQRARRHMSIFRGS